MFCSNCGSNNTDPANHFCSSCGSRIQSANPQMVPKSPSALQAIRSKVDLKKLFIGIGAVAIVWAGGSAIFANLPFSFDPAAAESKLMDENSFNFSMVTAKEPSNISELENPLFSQGEDCEQDKEAHDLFAKGEVLASTDLITDRDSSKSSSFHEDLIEFPTESEAKQMLNLVKEGYSDPDCSFNATYIKVQLSGLSTAQAEFGAGGGDSVTFKKDMRVKSDLLDIDFTFEDQKTYIQKGQYLLVIETSRTTPGADRTAPEMKEATTQSIKKMFG